MYFALRADYSAQDKYSAPQKGADGAKHIMVCTMLVGKYTKGTKDMKVAPALPNNSLVWKFIKLLHSLVGLQASVGGVKVDTSFK